MRFGIVGAVGRGQGFRGALRASKDIEVAAVCDIREDKLEEARVTLGAAEKYVDYETMLEKGRIDAVIIGTPMPLHASQAIAALKRNIHVMSEVTAAVSVDECRALVSAAKKSKAVYMMAENYCYMKPNVLIKNMAQMGLFGEVYYAEGEYLHDVTDLAETTTWRRKWQLGIDGVTYCTHSLGPILQCMPDDRVVRVCCEGSGAHHVDPRNEKYAQDTSVMLCKTAKGALIKIRVDLISKRPHAMTNYQIQGTLGVYESARGKGDQGKLWCRELSENVRWHDLDAVCGVDALAEKYMPEIWRRPPTEALKAGHGGGDFFEIFDFVNAINGTAPCPIGVHEAMDMTLPGLLSQQSIKEGGRWIDVPDTRTW